MAQQIVKGNQGDWEVVIGLEVHAQVISRSKLFSGSSTEFGAEPNAQVSLIDAAMPGMLPVLNEYCVEQAVRTGLGINAKINLRSVFDRKNYFYADLPQGYQISQFSDPIVGEGEIVLDMEEGEVKIGIERIHLEQDAGKSLHDQSPNETFIDLNRSGIALMEIVSKPDLKSAEEAVEYMKKLRSIVRYLGTCDGDMEKGNMRCDANISVKPKGSDKLGTRCEIKNLNSMRFLQKAIDYEANRQVELIESGGEVVQETRLFDTVSGTTKTMRSKENAHDYRYFPDPDLLPLEITQEFVDEIKASLPELPDQKKNRYVNELGITPYDASILVADKKTANFFEEINGVDAKLAANWISGELFGKLNKEGIDIENSPVSAAALGELLKLIKENVISGKIAKQVFEIMFDEKISDPAKIVEERGLKQVTNIGEIEKLIDQVCESNQDKVEQYRSGKDKLFGFFVGQVMKISQGKANPQTVNEILKKKLAG